VYIKYKNQAVKQSVGCVNLLLETLELFYALHY